MSATDILSGRICESFNEVKQTVKYCITHAMTFVPRRKRETSTCKKACSGTRVSLRSPEIDCSNRNFQCILQTYLPAPLGCSCLQSSIAVGYSIFPCSVQ